MEVHRLVKEEFSHSLSGKGAALKGARWNSAGVELIYTSSNRSLAMAEAAVHIDILTISEDFNLLTIYIPDDISLKKVNPKDLPFNWNEFPYPESTSVIGDKFVQENEYCVLMIPSSVTKGDYNFLINPKHPDFSRIKIIGNEKFPLDRRLFK